MKQKTIINRLITSLNGNLPVDSLDNYPYIKELCDEYNMEIFYLEDSGKEYDWTNLKDCPNNKILVGKWTGYIAGYITADANNPNRRWFHYLRPIYKEKVPIFNRDLHWVFVNELESIEDTLSNRNIQSFKDGDGMPGFYSTDIKAEGDSCEDFDVENWPEFIKKEEESEEPF